MNNTINVPQPKFAFGQKVTVVLEQRKEIHEACPDCEHGRITAKSGKTITCPACHGSGHTYKLIDLFKWNVIAGELTIDQVNIELIAPTSQRTAFYGNDKSPIAYQGHMNWFESYIKPNSQFSRQNVFHESSCFATAEEAATVCKRMTPYKYDGRNWVPVEAQS